MLVGPGMYERKVEHGVMIVATGANEYVPTEYGYTEFPQGDDPAGTGGYAGGEGGPAISGRW